MTQYAKTGRPPAAPGGTTSLLVPNYIYPSSLASWDHLNAAAPPVRYVIANANNGPGSSVDSNWTTAIKNASASGIRVLGYVNAGFNQTFTATNASPCVFTASGGGYGNDTAVQMAGAALPAGFTAETQYWVVGASGSTFKLAATKGGAAINSTSTGSGSVQVSLAQIASDISQWDSFYGVTDIFFDDVDTSASYLSYYAQACGFVHRVPGAICVMNHGAVPDEGYAAIADILVLFENAGGTSLATWNAFTPPAWAAGYPPEKFAVLVYSVSSSADMQTIISAARGFGIGNAFVTDQSGWTAEASYLAAEAGACLSPVSKGAGLVTANAVQTIPGQKTFTGLGTNPAGHWYGAVTTSDITVVPNSGISFSASMFLDNDAGQVWEFFCAAGGNFGAYDKTNSHQPLTFVANTSSDLNFSDSGCVVTGTDIVTATAGKGLKVKEGSNAKQGTATLSSGSVVVSNTSVTANSRIFLTAQDNNSTGALRISARTAGTSFTITSSGGTDSGVVAYEIFEPS